MAFLERDWYDAALAPRDQIVAYSRKVLAEFAGTHVWDPAAQLRAASAHAANEYAGRFLLELLQNAHDAHPADRHDGQITIVVDADEGAHGVVYVANGGTPFTHKSLSGLCKLARSPKQVGQGIGHKGVGFRSILSVCTQPEIYSADPTGPPGNLDGYTFRFAGHADLLTLADGDQALARRAEAEFPPFQLPVPVDTIPAAVRDLGADGHVTVVRLPLDTPQACTEALAQAAKLAASEVPVLLFLERIASLTVSSAEDPLTRDPHPLDRVEASDLSLTHVELGELGDFIVASAHVDSTRLHQAVQNAEQTNRMSADWQDWDDAVVSVALPAQGEVSGRMFTFLPMGEKAMSPFAGHLNAPFFTKLDRTDLDPGHPINDLLLDVAAETALAAATALQSSEIESARRWVSDLVCWDGPYRQRLASAADRSGVGTLIERQLVPIEVTAGHDTGWASLAETYRWPAPNPTVLTAARAAENGTCLLDSSVGSGRVDRWEGCADWLACSLRPDAETLAGFVEQIAAGLERPTAYGDADLLGTRRPKRRGGRAAKKPARVRRVAGAAARAALWAGVYRDLAALFPNEDTEPLRGRRLLVDDAGELRPANIAPVPPEERGGARRATAFLPPAREDSPVAVPASLRRQLFYLHPVIAEQLDATARGFLVDANLVYSYDIRNLLDHVRTVVARTESERIYRDALRFVFTLEQNGQIPPSYRLRELRLQIPTVVGSTVAATSAAFGPGWDDRDEGADLAAIIEDAGALDRELADLGHRLIDPVPDLVRPADSRTAWSAFLAKIGVTQGLPIHEPSATTPKLLGWQLRGRELASRTRVPAHIAEQWGAYLATQPARNIAYPQTEYVASRKPVWVVGQAIAEQLTDSARDAYARLILQGLARWPSDHLTMNWDRDRYGDKDRQSIPTPLAAFVATAAWLPAAPRPGRPKFGRADQLWHFPVSSDDAEPTFTPLVNRATRVFLDANPKVLAALRNAGLGIWSDPAHATRLVRDLGEAAAAGAVSDNQRDQFLRAYLRAWSNAASRPDQNVAAIRDLQLVLREGPRLSVRAVADLAADRVTVHLARPGDGLHLRLLDDLELPVLLVDADLEGARQVLARGLGDWVRIVDEAAVTVTPTGITSPGEALVEQLRWVMVLVAVAADHGHGLTLQERDFDDLARRLRRLRIRTYTTLGLRVFDQPTELPAASCGLFAEPDDADPAVLSPAAAADLTGPALVALAEEVAVAVGYAGLRERLRAAVLELQKGGNDRPDPDDADLASALRLTAAQVVATRTRLDGGLEAVIGRLYPVLVHWAGRAAADTAVDTTRAAGDLGELPATLVPLTASLPVAPNVLIDAARTTATGEELRISLGIEFADFNRTLASLAPAYAPVSHQGAHEQALRQHLALCHRTLCDQLRWARLGDFDAHRPQADWPELRSFDWVTIPDEWGITVDQATRADLTELVANAIKARLGYAPPVSGPMLPALDTVAAANKAQVTRAGPDIARLARAWTNAHRAALHYGLSSDDPGAHIADLLDANGALDFRHLSDDDISAWLDALGWWPVGMPVTTDPAAAGVTAEQLATADSIAAVARRQRERQRRLVRIGDHEVDVGVGAADIAALIDALQASLDAHPTLIAAPNRISGLQPMPTTSARGGRGGGRDRDSGGGDPMARLSDEQRQAFGFAGEWLAYQWLTRIYPEANESSWVSTNRRRVFPGDPGDDGLGFDFLVELRESIMFEVKASRAEPGVFTLTDPEIREARRHARDGRWRLLIVPYVSDPVRCQVLRLPNPFAPGAEGLFRTQGDGIKYRYRLDY